MASSKQCPIWIKEKEIQKVKAQKRVTYHEAKKLVNMYSVPKPNLPSYATVLKSSSMKDCSTQVCESDISPQTSVITTATLSVNDKIISSTPASAGPIAEAVTATSKPAATADAPKTSRRRNTSPPKNKPKQNSDRVPKGAKDPVTMHNKYGVLEEMEFTPSHSSSRVRSLSPKHQKGRISPVTHKKS